jgi:hypothetical protein
MDSKLKEWASRGQLKSAVLSEDGTSLSLSSGETLKADELMTIEKDGKTCEYSLASIFLQIVDPDRGLLAYRNACKGHHVSDPVTALDKPLVVAYFLGAQIVAAPVPPPPPPPKEERKKDRKHDKKDRDRHHKNDHHKKDHHKDRKRPPPPEAPPKKKEKKMMTTEQMLDNLNVVVGKRQGYGDDVELAKALSAEGFELTPEMTQESIADIVANEIPVGDSSSILRPAPSRDFQRVLDLYMETENRKKPVPPTQAPRRAYLVGKRPVIVLPKGMTSPITMWNAHEFFGNRKFIPRDSLVKQGVTKNSIQTLIKHRLDPRRGGHELEFELMDNPMAKLGDNPKEWERIVAVISLGASWQFKDWPRGYSTPVDLFGKVYGFYIGLEGDKEPPELAGWAVKKSYVSRDKRGMDSVCFAQFWEGLEDRMVTKKPEFLPEKAE